MKERAREGGESVHGITERGEEREEKERERKWRVRVVGETLAGSKGDEQREREETKKEKKVKASASPVFMESDLLFGNFTSSNIMQILG